MRPKRLGRAAVVSALALVLVFQAAACRPGGGTPNPGAGGGLRFGAAQTVATGLVVPWSIAFVTPTTMIVTERPGRFRVIENGQLRAQPVGQVTVTTTAEGGLMGIALHPQFATQRYAYAMYTAPSGNRVSRWPVGADLTFGTEQILLQNIPESTFHDGGEIAFGPDGMLYVATGYGPDVNTAADLTSLNGKILRITPEGGVPADNPFPGSKVWSYGHRNPQGLAWDSDGRMYESEHGPTIERAGLCCNDEINLITKGGFYGWPFRAGRVASGLGTGTAPAGAIDPIATSGTSATWAPANMALWNGPDGTTHIYQANLRGSNVMHFVVNKTSPNVVRSSTIETSGLGRYRTAKFGPDRCLYLSTSNRDSRGTPRTGDDRIIKLCPTS
jgi:glucose/arabinose dehydrogenase